MVCFPVFDVHLYSCCCLPPSSFCSTHRWHTDTLVMLCPRDQQVSRQGNRTLEDKIVRPLSSILKTRYLIININVQKWGKHINKFNEENKNVLIFD